jgi:hypothetical protein
MRTCFLEGYANCSKKMSGEHYISRSVLRELAVNGRIEVSGFQWQQPGETRWIGISSLQSKILCQTHNNELSGLDQIGGALFRTLATALRGTSALPPMQQFDGLALERWFLKILCGLAAATGFNNGVVPDEWKSIILGAMLPAPLGMYFEVPPERITATKQFALGAVYDEVTHAVLIANFYKLGSIFHLALAPLKRPELLGEYRPAGIIIRDQEEVRAIEFRWLGCYSPPVTLILHRHSGSPA